MKRIISSVRVLGLAVAGMAVLASCKKSFIDGADNTPIAGVMAFNLVPDKSAVAVTLSGTNITPIPLAFTNYSGAYLRILPGNRLVESFDNTNNMPIATAEDSFAPGKYYSVFVAGANSSYRNIVVHDNFDSLDSGNGQAYIRYVNAIPDSARPTVAITANGNSVVNEQAAFGNVSAFTAVAPGSVSIDLNNGSTIDADRTITVEARKVYTVLLTGVAGSTTTPVQIKFIANGELEEAVENRAATQGRAQSSN